MSKENSVNYTLIFLCSPTFSRPQSHHQLCSIPCYSVPICCGLYRTLTTNPHPSSHSLIYLSPQGQQESWRQFHTYPFAAPVPISLVSFPALPQNTCFGLPLISDPISNRSERPSLQPSFPQLMQVSQSPTPASIPCKLISWAVQENWQHTTSHSPEIQRGNRNQTINHEPN